MDVVLVVAEIDRLEDGDLEGRKDDVVEEDVETTETSVVVECNGTDDAVVAVD